MNDELNVPQIEETVEKIGHRGTPKMLIDNEMSFADVVEYDSKGIAIVFDANDLLQLDESQIRQLSHGTKMAYHLACQQSKMKNPVAEAFAKELGIEGPRYGRERDILDVRDTAETHYRWTRPDRVDARKRAGYHIAGADEAQSFLGAEAGIHSVKNYGKTELVLMSCPKKQFDEHLKKQADDNSAKLKAVMGGDKARADSGGAMPVIDFTKE